MSESVNVLLIEDNADDAIWLEAILEASRDIRLHWVQTLEAAVDALGKGKFHVVLADLTLPGSDPEASMRVLRDKAASTALIVLTGHDDLQFAVAALRNGAQDYLVKGKINIDGLIRAINYSIERKALLENIREQERRATQAQARLQLALEFCDIGLWSYDVASSKWDYDEKILAILGGEASNAQFADGIDGCMDCVHPDDRESVRAQLVAAVEKAQPFNLEHRIVRPDGELRYIIGKAAAFVDDTGAVVCLNGTAQDITEIKLRERDSRRSALHKQRDQFLAMLAHDLKTPLAASDRVLGALLDDRTDALPTKVKLVLGKLRGSNRALLQMVQNLLDDFRLESGAAQFHFEQANVSTLVDACVDEYREMVADRDLQFEVEIEPALQIAVDPIAIRRVAINLISNAIKFTPDGGTIKIQLHRHSDSVRLMVINSGPGIDPSVQHGLFKRFFQTDKTHRATGTGLGLHVCRLLVEAHGGTICCISEPGKGAAFEVLLPLHSNHLSNSVNGNRLQAEIIASSIRPE